VLPLEREAARRAHGQPAPHLDTNRSGHPLPFLDIIQRSFGHHDLSHVRAHTDSGAAAEALAIGAEAFARGSHVAFSRPPGLHTAAHEAAHVIQQRGGVDVAGGMGREGDAYERHADEVADRVALGQSSEALLDAPPGPAGLAPASSPVVQLRRIPPNVRALLIAGSTSAPNPLANVEGAERLVDLAMADLSPFDQVLVKIDRLGSLTDAEFNALTPRERVSRTAEAIIALFPALQLGDPNLIDTGARPATPDAANITKVVDRVNTIYTDIASGARDAWLRDVFGAGSITAAKAKYARGRTALNRIHGRDRIVTDRSGYSEEVSLGGLTDPPGTVAQKIRVSLSVIDSPDDPASITTLLHESMHAGNSTVSDDIYISSGGFTTQSASKKLNNSAHFEVVPWRILDATNDAAFPVKPLTSPVTFQTFIPAGTTVGGVTAPARTTEEKAAVRATDLMREAWTIGVNLHPLYVQVFRTPTDWSVRQPGFAGGGLFSRGLPFWSKVQKLTIHKKVDIDPTSADEAKHPVSQIDVALSEGMVRRLGAGMDVLSPLNAQADVLAFETAKATAAELTTAFPGGAHTDINRERDLLLKLAVRDPTVGPITGSVDRDLRVIDRLGHVEWSRVLVARDPATFADS
jgi:hypothetical protein